MTELPIRSSESRPLFLLPLSLMCLRPTLSSQGEGTRVTLLYSLGFTRKRGPVVPALPVPSLGLSVPHPSRGPRRLLPDVLFYLRLVFSELHPPPPRGTDPRRQKTHSILPYPRTVSTPDSLRPLFSPVGDPDLFPPTTDLVRQEGCSGVWRRGMGRGP